MVRILQQPKVSVVMSVYNGKKYLREAVESILNQTFRDFEFIIVDDGSCDNTLEILKDYAEKDSRIKIIKNEKNIGLTKSLNKAIQEAKGEYIARMDADDISLPERLKAQMLAMEKGRKNGLIGCDVIIIDEHGNEIKKVIVPRVDLNNYLRKKNCLVHGSLFILKKALQGVGNYSDEMIFAQDYDLLLKISTKYSISFVGDFLYKLRRDKNNISHKKFFPQLFYTAIAKANFIYLENRNLSILEKKLIFLRELFYTFFIIYKMGLPKFLRGLNLIK